MTIFDKAIGERMTLERAKVIRSLKVDEGGWTWRAIAAICHEDWGKDGDWEPHDNQLAGMDLCDCAAKMFNENYMNEPWN